MLKKHTIYTVSALACAALAFIFVVSSSRQVPERMSGCRACGHVPCPDAPPSPRALVSPCQEATYRVSVAEIARVNEKPAPLLLTR